MLTYTGLVRSEDAHRWDEMNQLADHKKEKK